jgi:hypothetical protein
MVKNYEPEQAFNLIIDDFIRAWECLAKANVPSKLESCAGARIPGKRQGPMFFGFLAMNLLEYICRLCATSTPALLEFSNYLNAIESKYFIHLPLADLRARDAFHMVNPSVDSEIRSAPTARKSKGVDCVGEMLEVPEAFNAAGGEPLRSQAVTELKDALRAPKL